MKIKIIRNPLDHSSVEEIEVECLVKTVKQYFKESFPQENFNTAENNAIKPIKNGRKTNSKKVHSQGENDAKKIVAAPMASDQNWMNRLSLKIHGKEAKGKIYLK